MTIPGTLTSPVVTTPLHEHAWVTESVHMTSEGRVRYVRCTACTARRVDLDAISTPPVALTHVVG